VCVRRVVARARVGGGRPPQEGKSQTLLPGKVRLIGFPGI